MRTEPVQFFSSNARLCEGFHWAKKQALAYAFDDAPVGPHYEAALPGRNAFCMRDAAHQAAGAHFLGLSAHNRNMMRAFARHISAERDFCTYWEITAQGKPAPVDYTSDADFWYNLPANFDLTCACSLLYDLTGEQGYLTDPVMRNFHRVSVTDYARRWDRDRDGIVDRKDSDGRRGIASYDEADTEGYVNAADALCCQSAAYAAAARMHRLLGEKAQAAALREKADALAEEFAGKWWNEEEKRFYTYRLADGTFDGRYSGANSAFPLRWDVLRSAQQIEGQLDYIIANEKSLNVEDRSYLPAIFWKYGRDEAAMDVWLRMTAPDYARREYPEVSFAAVDALITGYMGLEADASANTVHTCSAAAPEEWALCTDIPLWGGSIDLKHEGKKASGMTNRTGRTLIWQAHFGNQTKTVRVQPGDTARAEGTGL